MIRFNQSSKAKDIEDKFNYIKRHFTYNTLNSWNGLSSIANNVKIYNLGLTKEQEDKAFDLFNVDAQAIIDEFSYIIGDWELAHNGYTVGFNGRSDGYLVLYNEDNNKSVIDSSIDNYDTLDDLVSDMCEYYDDDANDVLKDYSNIIDNNFELVKDFDELCDDLLAQFIWIIENSRIEDVEVKTTRKVVVID